MKIAIFSDSFYPELSGISDSIITLAKELVKSGNQINFYVPYYSAKNYQRAKLFKQELDLGENIKINRLFSFPYRSGTGQARLTVPCPRHWLSIRNFSPDIIHTQLFFGVGLDALISAKINNIPIVGTNHTAITEFVRYSPIKAEWFKKLSMKYAVWYYNHCDYVTAPSQSVFDEMNKYGFNRSHRVVSNPVNLDIFSQLLLNKKQEIKKEFGLSDATLVCAGRLAPEKNVDVIIQALVLVKKRFPNVMLILAGHGNAADKLKNLAKTLNLEQSIKFLGTVDQLTLAKLYQASEIFVISSTSETQSMSLIQAMASGLPAVGVKARALPEYINDHNGFLVEPNDYRAFAEKLIMLLENSILRKKLGQDASAFVQKFSTFNIAKEWERIYNNVISMKNK